MSDYARTLEKVIHIAEKVSGKRLKGRILPNAELVDELGFDSIRILRMVIELEREFGVNIADLDSEADFSAYDTVAKIAALLEQLTQRQ